MLLMMLGGDLADTVLARFRGYWEEMVVEIYSGLEWCDRQRSDYCYCCERKDGSLHGGGFFAGAQREPSARSLVSGGHSL